MIFPSNDWEKQFYGTLLPETFIEISYKETDPEAVREAKESDNGTISYSKPQTILDIDRESAKEYATLEVSQWGLNGQFEILDTDSDTGYISAAIADEKGTFATNPAITISFDNVHEQAISGLTFDCGPEFPAEIKVSTYKDNEVRTTKNFINSDNKTNFTIPIKIENYNKIVVEFVKWGVPFHRARVHTLFVGINVLITKTDLTAYSHEQSGDILSGSLPQNKVTYSLDNTKGTWNPDNIVGDYAYLVEKQEISIRYGMRINNNSTNNSTEWIKGAKLWLYEWSTPANGIEATFTARDQTAFMSDTYTGVKSGTLYDLCNAAILQVELDNAEYYFDPVLKETTAKLEDNREYSISDILQLSANAACCVMFQDRDGILRIQPRVRNYQGYSILPFNSYSYPEFEATASLKSITINNQYGFNYSNKGQNQSMQNDLIQSQAQAQNVSDWVHETISGRNTISGEYRADPRIDLFDPVRIMSKFGTIQAMAVTDIKYEFNGCFKGTYSGYATDWEPNYYYFDELYLGDEI